MESAFQDLHSMDLIIININLKSQPQGAPGLKKESKKYAVTLKEGKNSSFMLIILSYMDFRGHSTGNFINVIIYCY